MRTLLLLGLLSACTSSGKKGDDAGDADTATGANQLVGPFLDGSCDPLVPEHCGFPFPSNVYLQSDASTPSGYRVHFGDETLPLAANDVRSSPTLLNAADGFSPAAGPMTFLADASGEGLVSPFSPEDSLLDDSKTIILNAETGARVPHFAELDLSQDDATRRTFMLRPVFRLDDATRYIVAIRGVVDSTGATIPPSASFEALRDDTSSDEPSVDARRDLYADIFSKLEAAGVPRGDLQIAWDFTTASRENNTSRVLAMRDESLAALPETGPTYTITSTVDDPNEHIARILEGTIAVPLYLTDGGPGGTLVVDDDGNPVQNGTYDYPFLVLIPKSCVGTPCPLLQFGHGLFGDRYTLESGTYEAAIDRFGAVGFAMDLIGMSNSDIPEIAKAAASGDVDTFATVPDRSQQNLLNMVLAMRMMMGPMVTDPATQFDGIPSIDPDQRVYLGGSQGGIYGASYMAVATDVQRGVLAVPGMAYSLMLPRSEYWYTYATPFLVTMFEDPRDVMLALGYIQMMWDRAEPSGYAPYITGDNLPNTPDHRVLLLEALGDHQVPNLSTELLARTVGAVQLNPRNQEHLGIDGALEPITEGNVLVDYDFGLPQVPESDVPMSEGDDPHGEVAYLDTVLVMAWTFLSTGEVDQLCDGACDPE